MSRHVSDFDLQPCLDGEPGAWSTFVERYARVIYAAVRKTIGGNDAELLDDLVQDVYVRLVRNDMKALRSFEPDRGASLTTWLTIIARSIAIDELRRRRLETASLDAIASEPEPPTDPSIRHELTIPLEVLTERQRLILSMLFDEGLSVSQAARVLDVDDQTVRSTKHKAMLRLREAMQHQQAGTTQQPTRATQEAGDSESSLNKRGDVS